MEKTCKRCGKRFTPDLTTEYCYDCWEWYLAERPFPPWTRGDDLDSQFANAMDEEDIQLLPDVSSD
jgi:hypothetical protein